MLRPPNMYMYTYTYTYAYTYTYTYTYIYIYTHLKVLPKCLPNSILTECAYATQQLSPPPLLLPLLLPPLLPPLLLEERSQYSLVNVTRWPTCATIGPAKLRDRMWCALGATAGAACTTSPSITLKAL